VLKQFKTKNKINISKAERLIVRDKEGNQLCNIEIGSKSLVKMQDKSQILTITQVKK
jgi:hypothetical protein